MLKKVTKHFAKSDELKNIEQTHVMQILTPLLCYLFARKVTNEMFMTQICTHSKTVIITWPQKYSLQCKTVFLSPMGTYLVT